MAIHDINKGQLDRSNPTPNVHGHLIPEAIKSAQTHSIAYRPNPSGAPTTRISFKNNVILYYDDQNRVIRVDGFIPSLAAYPVSITAVYGYDVYTDILGISAP